MSADEALAETPVDKAAVVLQQEAVVAIESMVEAAEEEAPAAISDAPAAIATVDPQDADTQAETEPDVTLE